MAITNLVEVSHYLPISHHPSWKVDVPTIHEALGLCPQWNLGIPKSAVSKQFRVVSTAGQESLPHAYSDSLGVPYLGFYLQKGRDQSMPCKQLSFWYRSFIATSLVVENDPQQMDPQPCVATDQFLNLLLLGWTSNCPLISYRKSLKSKFSELLLSILNDCAKYAGLLPTNHKRKTCVQQQSHQNGGYHKWQRTPQSLRAWSKNWVIVSQRLTLVPNHGQPDLRHCDGNRQDTWRILRKSWKSIRLPSAMDSQRWRISSRWKPKFDQSGG